MKKGLRINTKWIYVGADGVECGEEETDLDTIPPIIFVPISPTISPTSLNMARKNTSTNQKGRKPGAKGWKAEELRDALPPPIAIAEGDPLLVGASSSSIAGPTPMRTLAINRYTVESF